MYHYEKLLKASDIVWFVSTSAVIWSSVLISVTWVELLWTVYKFFRITNIDQKCSFVWCLKKPQVMIKWRRRASHLSRFTLWHNGCELHNSVDLLCRPTAAKLHNLVYLLCGTTAAETFERWSLWKIQQIQIDSRPSGNSRNMSALRRQNSKPQQTFDRWTPRTRITMWISASKWGKT